MALAPYTYTPWAPTELSAAVAVLPSAMLRAAATQELHAHVGQLKSTLTRHKQALQEGRAMSATVVELLYQRMDEIRMSHLPTTNFVQQTNSLLRGIERVQTRAQWAMGALSEFELEQVNTQLHLIHGILHSRSLDVNKQQTLTRLASFHNMVIGLKPSAWHADWSTPGVRVVGQDPQTAAATGKLAQAAVDAFVRNAAQQGIASYEYLAAIQQRLFPLQIMLDPSAGSSHATAFGRVVINSLGVGKEGDRLMHELAHYCSLLLERASPEYVRERLQAYQEVLETVGAYRKQSRSTYVAADAQQRAAIMPQTSWEALLAARHTNIELEGHGFTLLLDPSYQSSDKDKVMSVMSAKAKAFIVKYFSPLAAFVDQSQQLPRMAFKQRNSKNSNLRDMPALWTFLDCVYLYSISLFACIAAQRVVANLPRVPIEVGLTGLDVVDLVCRGKNSSSCKLHALTVLGLVPLQLKQQPEEEEGKGKKPMDVVHISAGQTWEADDGKLTHDPAMAGGKKQRHVVVSGRRHRLMVGVRGGQYYECKGVKRYLRTTATAAMKT